MAVPYSFLYLYTEAAAVMKNSRDLTTLSAADLVEVKALVNRAYIAWCSVWCPPVGLLAQRPEAFKHTWKFMDPAATLSLTIVGAGTYALPAGFGGMIDDPVFANGQTYAGTIQRRPVEYIKEQWGASTVPQGQPLYYAIEPVTFTAATGQRWQLLCTPIPTTTVTVNYRYHVSPVEMSTDTETPLGGVPYSACLLACIRAQWEIESGKTVGTMCDVYASTLLAAIQQDKQSDVMNYGYMTDGTPDIEQQMLFGSVDATDPFTMTYADP